MFGSPKRSALISGSVHAGAIALVLLATGPRTSPVTLLRHILYTPSDIDSYRPSVTHPLTGGGGGGGRSPLPASSGRLPRFARAQFVPPVVEIQNYNPVLPMEPTLAGDSRIVVPTLDLSRYGDPHGVNGVPSAGPGCCGGIGSGNGTGVGPGRGPGYGPGEGPDGITGGSRMQGEITGPIVLLKPEPEYSEEARRAKLTGKVVLTIDVNTLGQAQNFRVVQSLGLGLDERAVEAVKRWKFRPGTRNGKPIVTPAIVEVYFRLL